MSLDISVKEERDSENSFRDSGSETNYKACKKRIKASDTTETYCTTCETDLKHYSCAQCNKQYFSKMGITAHLRKHKRPPPVCKICKKEFEFNHKLQKHMLSHSNKRLYSCNVCQKRYKSKSSLAMHMHSHEPKQYRCEYCPKRFTQKSHQQVHMRLHTGIKPYKCDECAKEFTQKTSLNNHALKHRGVKPHRCQFCKKRFRQVSNLKQHIEKHHQDKKTEKNRRSLSLIWYSCKNCNAILTSKVVFKKHMELCHK